MWELFHPLGEPRIYVDFQELNKSYEKDPFTAPFIEKTLENIVGNEVYSFTDVFLGYHQAHITKEYHPKIIFTKEWEFFMDNVAIWT